MNSTFRILSHLSLAVLVAVLIATVKPPTARAEQTTRVRKTTTSTVVKEIESDKDDEVNQPLPGGTPIAPRESIVTARFGAKGLTGMSGCKTEDLSKEQVKDLKGDCTAWVKDQKVELKDRFLTSSCEENCDDCGTSLRRCSVTGTVHFLLK